jgi:hypothetical protein
MKRLLFVFAAAGIFAACQNSDKKAGDKALTTEEKEKALSDTTNYTTMEWLDPVTKDLGELIKDQTIELTYRFKNTGNKILVIENVSAQCGCTIPEKPEKPISPGEEGVIKAKFNGRGQGMISKQIYVKANTKPTTDHTLTFTGTFKE